MLICVQRFTPKLHGLAIGPAPHRVSRALRARNPGKFRKESGKGPKSAPRSLERDFRLFSDSFETPGRTLWALLGPCPRALFFPDSFRTLPGFRARRARETLCGAGPIASPWTGRLVRTCSETHKPLLLYCKEAMFSLILSAVHSYGAGLAAEFSSYSLSLTTHTPLIKG